MSELLQIIPFAYLLFIWVTCHNNRAQGEAHGSSLKLMGIASSQQLCQEWESWLTGTWLTGRVRRYVYWVQFERCFTQARSNCKSNMKHLSVTFWFGIREIGVYFSQSLLFRHAMCRKGMIMHWSWPWVMNDWEAWGLAALSNRKLLLFLIFTGWLFPSGIISWTKSCNPSTL